MYCIRPSFVIAAVAFALVACSSGGSAPADTDAAATPDLRGADVAGDASPLQNLDLAGASDLAPMPDLGATADMAVAADLPRALDGAGALDLGRPLDTTGARDLPPDLPAPVDAATTDGAPLDAGCAGWTPMLHLSPADSKTLIETANPIVINVHYPYEGDIPGTDATIPFDDVDAIEAYLGHDHCADLLLVCKSGSMSTYAGNELVRRGYLRVRELKGGLLAWAAAGYPVLKDGGI